MIPPPPRSTLFPYTTLFRSILSLRSAIGLTQAGLSDHLGISKKAVGEWEAGSSYPDRKSTRLNSSHGSISYAVFCLKKKKKTISEEIKYHREIEQDTDTHTA